MGDFDDDHTGFGAGPKMETLRPLADPSATGLLCLCRPIRTGIFIAYLALAVAESRILVESRCSLGFIYGAIQRRTGVLRDGHCHVDVRNLVRAGNSACAWTASRNAACRSDALLFFVALNWFLYYFIPSLGRSAFAMPDGEIMYRFGNDAQQLGLQIAWAVGLLLSLTFAGIRRWRMTLPILLILAITLVRTQSRTGIITTAIVAGVVIWRWLTPKQKFYAVITALAFGAIIGFDFWKGNEEI